MTQNECLAALHHFTHLGICYPGSVAYVGLTSADHPTPVTFSVKSVPEPSTAALFAIALVVGVVSVRIRGVRSEGGAFTCHVGSPCQCTSLRRESPRPTRPRPNSASVVGSGALVVTLVQCAASMHLGPPKSVFCGHPSELLIITRLVQG